MNHQHVCIRLLYYNWLVWARVVKKREFSEVTSTDDSVAVSPTGHIDKTREFSHTGSHCLPLPGATNTGSCFLEEPTIGGGANRH